jgi:glycerol-3-phosphate dehydrogenase
MAGLCAGVAAAQRGAKVLVRTECIEATRSGGTWTARLSDGQTLQARALVNAAGPWVKSVLNERLHQPSSDSVRLVRGSHIVLPRLYEGEHAFILQNDDRRVVFMIPYEERFTLVGTTDEAQADMSSPQATAAEVDYLCRAANRYLARPVAPAEVAWRYAGVRPLYDDGTADPSSVTRDYTLRVDDEAGTAPVLSIFGGKITIYRSLAEAALQKLEPYFPAMRGPWTGREPLPGSRFDARDEARRDLLERYRALPADLVRGVFRRHGVLAQEVLGDGVVGEHYGADLCEREVRYLKQHEWARSAEDVLWRRTKAGLHLDAARQARVAELMGG